MALAGSTGVDCARRTVKTVLDDSAPVGGPTAALGARTTWLVWALLASVVGLTVPS